MVAVLVALAVHGCTGAKSLLKDMGIARRRIMPLRIAIIVVSCIIGIAALL
jgi:succinate dehydrogenase hydrophobic anchor subunit